MWLGRHLFSCGRWVSDDGFSSFHILCAYTRTWSRRYRWRLIDACDCSYKSRVRVTPIPPLPSHSTGFITPWSAGDDSKAWQPPACRLVDCVADKRFSVLSVPLEMFSPENLKCSLHVDPIPQSSMHPREPHHPKKSDRVHQSPDSFDTHYHAFCT